LGLALAILNYFFLGHEAGLRFGVLEEWLLILLLFGEGDMRKLAFTEYPDRSEPIIVALAALFLAD